MLKISEHTPQRMALKDQRPVAGMFAILFTVVSLISVVILLVQGVESLFVIGRDFQNARILGFVVFMLIGVGFVLLGGAAVRHFLQGTAFILDKTQEQATLKRMMIFRREVKVMSIYAISHLDVQANPEFKVYGLFIVLRSGERLPLASFQQVDEVHMRTLMREVSDFLRS